MATQAPRRHSTRRDATLSPVAVTAGATTGPMDATPVNPAVDPTTELPPQARLGEIARRQHGLITRGQAADAGVARHQLNHLVDRGHWEAITRKVLRSTATPTTPRQRAMAALLDLGQPSGLTRPSALSLWTVPGFRLDPVHVVVARTRRSGLVEPAQLHTATWLTEDHLTIVDGLWVTRPEVTVIDVADSMGFERLERLVDKLWGLDLLRPSSLERTLEAIGRKRRGRRALEAILAERDDADRPPGSNLESRFAQVLRSDGQRPMRRQVWIGEDAPIGRVDFVDDEARLIVEVQSDLHHASPSDRRRDAERHRRLEAEGWTVREVWEDRVWHDGPALAADVRRWRSEGRQRQAA